MFDRLATIDMGRKWGELLCLFPWGSWVKKWGLLCPFGGRRTGYQSDRMWSGLRPTSLPSGILIHQAVWPQ